MLEDMATHYGADDAGVISFAQSLPGGMAILHALSEDRHAELPALRHVPPDKPVALPEAVTLGATIRAEVNHGRWIVRCPSCASAQYASRTDRRFFCIECLNANTGGAWLKVEWPAEAEAIEAALERRPELVTRGWLPGQSAADLAAENESHGIA